MKLEKGQDYLTRSGKVATVVAINLALGGGYTAVAKIKNHYNREVVFQYTEKGECLRGKKRPVDLMCLNSVEDAEKNILKENNSYFNKRGNKVVIISSFESEAFIGFLGYEEFPDGRQEVSTYSLFGDYDLGKDDERDILLSSCDQVDCDMEKEDGKCTPCSDDCAPTESY